MKVKQGILVLAAAMLFLPPAYAVDEKTPGWFPFYFPSLENPPTDVDLSAMNEKPAGKNGRIAARDDHFVDGNGERIRFLGTNLTFDAPMPPLEIAPKLAAHLSRMGINILRIHHIDSHRKPQGIFAEDWQTLDPEMLDRLDKMIAELIGNGVYVNMNLHVGREYPGLPANLPRRFRMGKIVDYYYQPFIEMQKEYARQILLHENKYLGRPLAEDPGLAIVEINNENSLFQANWEELDAMPEEFRAPLMERWHAFLAKRYESDEALRKAWAADVETPGEEMIANGDFSRGMETVEIEQVPPVVVETTIDSKGGPDGSPAFKGSIIKAGGVGHAFQVNAGPLKLETGKRYTLSFDARSTDTCSEYLSIRASTKPPHSLQRNPTYTKEWRHFEYTFQANEVAGNNPARATFNFGAVPGTWWIDNVSVKPGHGASTQELLKTVTRESAGIPQGSMAPQQEKDFNLFLFEIDAAYTREMTDYLRNELKVKALITNTQVGHSVYGGLSSYYREAPGDLIDTHFYWQHPSFMGLHWDPKFWYVENTPQSSSPEGGALAKMAMSQLLNKPYTISEYNIPAPSWYNAEYWPMFASFGAFHGIDGIFQYTYSNGKVANLRTQQTPADWDVRMVEKFFNMDGNPAQLAFCQWAAIAFRTGAFETDNARAELQIPADAPTLLENIADWSVENFWKANGYTPDMLDQLPMGLKMVEGLQKPRMVKPEDPVSSPIEWKMEKGGTYKAVSEPAVTILGAIANGESQQAGPFTISVQPTSNGHATFAAAALDAKPLAESDKILVTIMNRFENTGWKWNEANTSIGDDWGRAPTICEGITASFDFEGNGKEYKVHALDGTGAVLKEIPAVNDTGKIRFSISPEDRSLWFILKSSN